MRILPLVALAGVAALGQRATAQPASQIAPAQNAVPDFVTEAARRFAIPEAWIYAVIRVESAGNPHAVSPKGAAGLMQIMPGTWLGLRARFALGEDIYDPHDNIIAGAGYLRDLFDRYGSPGFLAAYNAGPARYEKYMTRGVSLPGETIAYVQKLGAITAGGIRPRTQPATIDPTVWTRAALFAGASRRPEDTPRDVAAAADIAPDRGAPGPSDRASLPSASGLFIPRSGQARQ